MNSVAEPGRADPVTARMSPIRSFLESVIGRPSSRAGETLSPFELRTTRLDFRDMPFEEMLKALRVELRGYRDQRIDYFTARRRSESPWANGARKFLAVLGAGAVLLAAIASAANLLSTSGSAASFVWLTDYHIAAWAAGLSLLAYALIGAISSYEKATETTSAYFRHLSSLAAIRDLWTKLEFALLTVVLETPKDQLDSSIDARKKVQALAEEFVTNLNKASSDELSVWHTDFIASLTKIDETAKTGREKAEDTLKTAVAEAKAATDRATAAAAAAEQAGRPAIMNLEIEGGFDGDVSILIDDREVAQTTLAAYPVLGVTPGQRKIEVRGKKGDTPLAAVEMVDLKPGIQPKPIQIKLRSPGGGS